MTEKYVKLSDIEGRLYGCEYTIGPDPSCTGRIVPNNWLENLPVVELGFEEDKKEEVFDPGFDADEPNIVFGHLDEPKETGRCPYYRTNETLSYDKHGVPEVKVVSYCQRERNKGQTGDICYCNGRKIACLYSAKTRREGIAEEMSPDEKERMYWIRTHMTAISRYLKNENPEHAEDYKKLALEAAQAILRIVNGGINGEET